MRKIGHVTRKSEAENFEALALAKGIRISFREGSDPAAREVWVQDDSRVDEGKELLSRFLSGEKVEELDEAVRKGAALKKQQRDLDDRYKRRMQLARKRSRAANGSGNVSMAIIVLCVGVALLLGFNIADARGTDLLGRTAATCRENLSPLYFSVRPSLEHLPEVRHGQIWRLFTPALIHGSLIHILFNMYMFAAFGRGVEVRKGAAFFIPFVIVTAIASNLAQYAWTLATVPIARPMFGGMSGVLYALLGYLWIKGRIDPGDRLTIDRSTLMFLLAWLVAGFVGIIPNIANFAHLGGLVAGMLYAPLDVAWFEISKRR